MSSGSFSGGIGSAFAGTQISQVLAAHSGPAAPMLLDVVRTNGDSFHWANAQLTAAPVYTGNTPAWASSLLNPPAIWDRAYFPWLLSATDLHFYRSTQASSGRLLVQNISGNSLQRDVAGLLTAASFEGAIFALRLWLPHLQLPSFEMHGRLTIAQAGELTSEFALGPLFDSSSYDGNPYQYSETCQWNYAEPGCGDTTANPCTNSYTTCRQIRRFFGVLNTFQVNVAASPSAQINMVPVNRLRMM